MGRIGKRSKAGVGRNSRERKTPKDNVLFRRKNKVAAVEESSPTVESTSTPVVEAVLELPMSPEAVVVSVAEETQVLLPSSSAPQTTDGTSTATSTVNTPAIPLIVASGIQSINFDAFKIDGKNDVAASSRWTDNVYVLRYFLPFQGWHRVSLHVLVLPLWYLENNTSVARTLISVFSDSYYFHRISSDSAVARGWVLKSTLFWEAPKPSAVVYGLSIIVSYVRER